MIKIAVIAYETTKAVCSSMMMHVNMMSDCGCDITMVISNDIDKQFFEGCKYKKEYYSSRKELKGILKKKSFDKIWCTNSVYVLYLKLIGVKTPICLWMQGDTPAESYMAHHSKIRRFLLQRVVAFSFRNVAGIIYVSDAMKEYYEAHYRKTPDNNIIVPCLSEFQGLAKESERIPNSFVYIGGLSVWQCFDEILQIYKSIRTDDSVFHIITLDVDKAREKVTDIMGDSSNIEIYSIKDRNEIPDVLKKFQYGFLIRKNDIVNLVSSPIKFLEYISCGVDVIMTDAIPSYAKLVEEKGIGTVVKIGERPQIRPYSSNANRVYQELFRRDIYLNRYNVLIKKVPSHEE